MSSHENISGPDALDRLRSTPIHRIPSLCESCDEELYVDARWCDPCAEDLDGPEDLTMDEMEPEGGWEKFEQELIDQFGPQPPLGRIR